MFNPLTRVDLFKIIDHQIKSISERLENRDITLALNDDAKNLIIEHAYLPAYGARPLRRYLEKKFVTQLGRMLLDSTVGASTKDDKNKNVSLTDHSIVNVEDAKQPQQSPGPSIERDEFRYIIHPKTLLE